MYEKCLFVQWILFIIILNKIYLLLKSVFQQEMQSLAPISNHQFWMV